MPTQTVASIMMSVISMLNDPNLSSPANVEASVMYRDRREEFDRKCGALAAKSKPLVPPHIKIPHPETNEQERQRARLKNSELNDTDLLAESFEEQEDDNEDSRSDNAEFAHDNDDQDPSTDGRVSISVPEDSKPPRKKNSKKSASSKSQPKEDSTTAIETATQKSKKDGKAEKKKKKEEKKKIKAEETEIINNDVEDEDASFSSGSSSSSSSSAYFDAKELENLLQLDPEFQKWRRTWLNLSLHRASAKGWAPVKSSSGSSSNASSGGAGNGPKSSATFSILTYNVLRHSTAEASHRIAEQLKILREANATVLVLNDVLPSFLQELGDQAFLQGYYCAYAHNLASNEGNDANAQNDGSFKGATTLVLSKWRILQAQVLPLPSRSDKCLVRVECENKSSHSSGSIIVIAAHLDDSPRDMKLRVQQLDQLRKASEGFTLQRQPSRDHSTEIFFAGDLGLGATTKEIKVLDGKQRSRGASSSGGAIDNILDAWTCVHPDDPGITYNPEVNKLVRVLNSSAQYSRRDRILYSAPSAPSRTSISPIEAQLLGKEKIPDVKYKGSGVWPSDHFALYASFSGLSESSSASNSSSSKKAQKCIIS